MLNVHKPQIESVTFGHLEFMSYSLTIEKAFLNWKKKNVSLLNEIQIGAKPEELIFTFSESLVEEFSRLDLIDKYDIYEHLMAYWAETMQDDVYVISQNGWKAEISTIKSKKDNYEIYANTNTPLKLL